MNIVLLGIGLALIAGGIAGIAFVSVPLIYGIGTGIETAIEGDVEQGVGNTIINAILAYVSVGFFIVMAVVGVAFSNMSFKGGKF